MCFSRMGAKTRILEQGCEDPWPLQLASSWQAGMTAEQERAFPQTVKTTRRQRKPMTEEQRVAHAYVNAMGLYR